MADPYEPNGRDWRAEQRRRQPTRAPRPLSSYDSVSHGKAATVFVVWFAFCAVVALALLGLGVWAVIELVTWVTTK